MFVKSFSRLQKNSQQAQKQVPQSISSILKRYQESILSAFHHLFLNQMELVEELKRFEDFPNYTLNLIQHMLEQRGPSFFLDFKRFLRENIFSNEHVLYFEDVLHFIPPDERFSTLQLAIMDEATLNDLIMINDLANQVRKNNESELTKLALRIAHVLPNSCASLNDNPIDPKNLLLAFNLACQQFEFHPEEKKYLFALFERRVLGQLPLILSELNDILIEHGVLQQLTAAETVIKAPVKTPSSRASQASPAHSHVRASSRIERPADSKYLVEEQSLLSRLLTEYGHREQTEDQKSIEKIPLKRVIQTELPKIDPSFTSQQLSKRDKNVISLFDTLFGKLLADNNLNTVAKSQFSRLQLSILNAALHDKDFLRTKNHPMRQILNKIAKVGADWLDTDDKMLPQVQQLDGIVDELVLAMERNDSKQLQSTQQKLDDMLAKMEKNYRLICKRMQDAERARQLNEQAKEVVDRSIARIFQDQWIPQSVEELVNEVWRKSFQLTYLKFGETHQQWEALIKSLKHFVRAVQPRTSKSTLAIKYKQKIVKKSLKIQLDQLGKGPNAFNRFEPIIDNLFADYIESAELDDYANFFTRHHVKKWTNVITLERKADSKILASNANESDESQQPSPLSEKALQFIEQLQSDTWIEYHSGVIKKRVKFVCCIGEPEQFIFLNRYGRKELCVDKHALGELVDQDHIRILTDSDIFDRALEKTIEHMRQMARQRQLNA